jgi:hypothetical protein
MGIRVQVKSDSMDICRVRISTHRVHMSARGTKKQNWIKFYPSKRLCVAELRYLGMLTHLEADVLQNDFCLESVMMLQNIDAEVDVLKIAGFKQRKSRFPSRWKQEFKPVVHG